MLPRAWPGPRWRPGLARDDAAGRTPGLVGRPPASRPTKPGATPLADVAGYQELIPEGALMTFLAPSVGSAALLIQLG